MVKMENILKIYLRNNIPYLKLKELFNITPNYQLKETCNLFIDVETLIKPLLSSVLFEEYKNFTEERLTYIFMGLMMGTASHYRNYFYENHGLFTNIYFFYSSKRNKKYMKIFQDYKKDFYSKYIRPSKDSEFYEYSLILKKSIKNFKKIVDYISYVYLLDMENYDKNIIPKYVIEKINPSSAFNLILTNDDVLYQYCYLTMNTRILNLKGSNSKIISKSNLIEECLGKENFLNIKHEMFSNILTLIGSDRCSIPGLLNMKYGRAYNLLHKGIFEKCLRNTEYYEQDEFIKDLSKIKDVSKKYENLEDTIKRNFKLLNLKYVYEKYFNKFIFFSRIDQSIKDKYNYKLLCDVNNMYFTDVPLNLEFLMKGSDYKF